MTCFQALVTLLLLRHVCADSPTVAPLSEAGNSSSFGEESSSTEPDVEAEPEPEPEQQVQVRLLQTARLICAPAPGKQLWTHDWVRVDPRQEARYSLDGSHLSIASVSLRDAGRWQCERRDAETRNILATSSPIRLVVLEPPTSVRLVVVGAPGNATASPLSVSEGAALRLLCEVEGGVPAPSLSWWVTLGDGTSLPLNTSAASTREAVLDKVARTHHNASLSCLARHPALLRPLSAAIMLDVTYSPYFAISRIPGFGFPLREGMAVSLKCDVDSNPPANPLWLKDGKDPPVPQSGDGFLNFSSISRDHSGWYKCSSLGASSIGYFLNVREDDGREDSTEKPDLERGLEVPLGSTVTLQCPGGGASCWSKLTSDGSQLEPVGAGPDLTIERVLYQEAGNYRCEPVLDDRHTQLTVNLTVRGVPVVYTQTRNLTASAGDSVTLAVEFCANPPADRTLWLLESSILQPGDVIGNAVAHNVTASSSPHCQHAALMLKDLVASQSGEYVFLVRSPRGLAEGSITLQILDNGENDSVNHVPAVWSVITLQLILVPTLRTL